MSRGRCHGRPRLYASLVCAAAISAAWPSTVAAQSWQVIDALGYGATGAVVGVLALTPDDCSGQYYCGLGEALVGLLAGGAVGAFAGSRIGGSADEKIRLGEPLTQAHIIAVSAGAVAAGAWFGAYLGDRFSDSSGDPNSRLSADPRTVALMAAAGATASIIYLAVKWDGLTGSETEVRPTMDARSRFGLAVTFRH